MYDNVRQCKAMYGNVRQALYDNVRQAMRYNVRQCKARLGNDTHQQPFE